MESNPKPRRTNLFVYLLLGLFFGLLLAGLASVVALMAANIPITWDNLVQLHTGNPLFLVIDVYAIFFALLFGFIGLNRDRTAFAQAQLKWATQKHSVDLQAINNGMTSKEQEHKELEAVISRGKQQWEATFDAVKDLIILTDENGGILRCNRATGEAFQTGFSQIIGRQIDDLFLGAVRGDQKILTDRTEVRFPELEGWYEATKNFLMMDGQHSGWVYVIRDITERKHAMQEVQRLNQYYSLVVKNSPIAIVTLALDDRIIDCNPAFETLFGYTRKESVGWNIDSLISPPDRVTETQEMGDAVRKGETIHQVTRRKHKDGTVLDMEVFGIPVIIGGKLIGVLALYHDVSELVASDTFILPVSQPLEEAWITENELPSEELEDPGSEEPPFFFDLENTAEDLDMIIASEAEAEAPALVAPAVMEEAQMVEESVERKQTFKQRAVAIDKIEGIGPVYAQKLTEIGIETTDDLLQYGKTRKGREELVEKLDISGKLVLKWVNMADLMRVKGVGEEYSELLEKAGVDTVKELRNRKPENLHAALVTANELHKLVRRPPHLSEVEGWVQSAKALEPLISY